MVKLAFKLAKYLTHFTFTLEMFIEHLKVSDKFETSDLDLDGQICHNSLNICVIPCECDTF